MRLSDSRHLTSLPRSRLRRPAIVGVTLALVALVAIADFAHGGFAPISHLYYLPILLAATKLGRRYALGVAALAVVLAHLADPQLSRLHYEDADVMELILFMTVAVVASRLTEDARELRRLASTDDLTGLHNLRSFESFSRAFIERQRSAKGSVAMLSLDVDHLKQLNDTYGHLTGADAVRHVGGVLARLLPDGAQACRYGGDEFAIVMPATDQAHLALAREIQEAVSASAPVLDTRSFPAGTLSVSIGCSSAVIDREVAAVTIFTQLFRAADEAMYANKLRPTRPSRSTLERRR
jgi:diguanylate cyclase (GGDEF)-like protein